MLISELFFKFDIEGGRLNGKHYLRKLKGIEISRVFFESLLLIFCYFKMSSAPHGGVAIVVTMFVFKILIFAIFLLARLPMIKIILNCLYIFKCFVEMHLVIIF